MSNTTDAITLSTAASSRGFLTGELNVWGLVSVIIFYLIILAVGIFASWKTKSWTTNNSEDVMVAGREIGLVVGVFTMTATWVGGGYINGTAEIIFTPGSNLVWCQAPIGYAASLVLGGIFFAKQMREAGYVTMLDPFQKKYGRIMGALLYLPALLGDIFWTAAILSALGATLSVIIGLQHNWAVIISAAVSVLYTLIGGLFSVAYTDVIQLICTFVGLWLTIPFALTNDAVLPIGETAKASWLGSLAPDKWIGLYIDSGLLLICGGIPWQVYFQRVLSQKSASRARMLSFAAAFGCLIMTVPSILIGAIGTSTKWNETDYVKYRKLPIPEEDYKLILPLVLQYLTPDPVAVIGLGAVSGAVMSSSDSSVLSSSSMFSRNVYQPLRDAISASCCRSRSRTSETEIVWVMRVCILLVGAASAAMAITVDSIYGLWYLCSDFIYVMLFPQLTCVVHVPFTNSYGSFVGFCTGLFFRLTGGEVLLNFDALIKYPYFDEETGYQCFPFKTLSMLISLVTILSVSAITNELFTREILPPEADIAHVFRKSERQYSLDQVELNAHTNTHEDSTNCRFRSTNDNRVAEDNPNFQPD